MSKVKITVLGKTGWYDTEELDKMMAFKDRMEKSHIRHCRELFK